MATITAQSTAANTLVTYTAVSAGGDTYALGTSQRGTIVIRNASAGAITVTLTAINACNQGFLHNVVVTCNIGDTEIAVPANCINTQGQVAVTYSAATSISGAALVN